MNFLKFWKSLKNWKIIQKLSKSIKNSKITQMHENHPITRISFKYSTVHQIDKFWLFLESFNYTRVFNDFRVFGWISRIWTIIENVIGFGVFEWFSTFWMSFHFLNDSSSWTISEFSMIFDVLNDTREFEWFWSI